MTAQFVPVTVLPAAGCVMNTCRVPLLLTVTVRVAVPEPPTESVTVSASVWVPLATVRVSHDVEAEVAVVFVV